MSTSVSTIGELPGISARRRGSPDLIPWRRHIAVSSQGVGAAGGGFDKRLLGRYGALAMRIDAGSAAIVTCAKAAVASRLAIVERASG